MTPDPDILAIQRRRRQQKRCVRCGVRTPRAALCVDCRSDLRYCPRCESVYPKALSDDGRDGRASGYCVPCATVTARTARGKQERDAYLASARARMGRLLPPIIRLYRRGATYAQIAAALGMRQSQLAGLIGHARSDGRWPAEMRRYSRQEHDG